MSASRREFIQAAAWQQRERWRLPTRYLQRPLLGRRHNRLQRPRGPDFANCSRAEKRLQTSTPTT